MILSHRGNGTRHAPNTLEAFESALRTGADGFECDLRITGDGNVVVYHDGNLRPARRKVSIGRSSLQQIAEALAPSPPLLTLDELFDYIAQVRVPAFLELKNLSPVLMSRVLEGTKRTGLWDLIHVIGFPVLVRNAVLARRSEPRLQVLRIGLVPAPALLLSPPEGDGVLVGWQDTVPVSERFFRSMLSARRLAQLRERYTSRGMRVIGGVLNRPSGLQHFRDAGITDVVTDDVATAVAFRDARLVGGDLAPASFTEPATARSTGASG